MAADTNPLVRKHHGSGDVRAEWEVATPELAVLAQRVAFVLQGVDACA
jgi:hypothetical protein